MIENLNMFDTTIIIIMVLSCLIAFFRGFVREILSLGAWVGAGIVTLHYFKPVAEYLKPHFKNDMVAAGMGSLGLYIVSLMGFSLLTMMLLKLMKSGKDVGMLDNILGLGFGAFRGAFIISLGFFILTIVMKKDEYPDWLKESVTRTHVEQGATLLASVSPKYLRELSSLHEGADELAEKRKEDPYDDSWLEESSQELKDQWQDIEEEEQQF